MLKVRLDGMENAISRTGKEITIFDLEEPDNMTVPLSLTITGVLSENAKGWTKELNLVSWNDREPKYDIREWSPDHSKMGKGCTLTADELAALKDIINEIDLDSFE